MFDGNNSAAIAYNTWMPENLTQFHSCELVINGNLYLENGQRNRGIITTINTLNFRKDDKGECIDYVQITLDHETKYKICDQINDDTMKRIIVQPNNQTISVKIFVNKLIPLSDMQPTLDINLTFTAFQSMFD